jgi:hypothetical protein
MTWMIHVQKESFNWKYKPHFFRKWGINPRTRLCDVMHASRSFYNIDRNRKTIAGSINIR